MYPEPRQQLKIGQEAKGKERHCEDDETQGYEKHSARLS